MTPEDKASLSTMGGLFAAMSAMQDKAIQRIRQTDTTTSLCGVSLPLPLDLVALSDETAVILFSRAMVDKMALSRAKGRGGWQNCSIDELWDMLRDHVQKGDPVDVANLAMMIWHNAKRAG